MKYLRTFLLTLLFAIAILATAAVSWTDLELRHLPGHIEYLSSAQPMSIKRLTFASGMEEEVFRASSDKLMFGFDTVLGGRLRVFSIINQSFSDFVLALLRDSRLPMLTIQSGGNVLMMPSLSPDGRQIAYGGNSGIFVMAVDGTSKMQVSKVRFERDIKPTWFPDSRTLVVDSADCRVYMINLVTGQQKEVLDFGKAPAVSHDGKKIAYFSREGDEEDMSAFRHRSVNGLSWWRRVTWNDYLAVYIYDVATGKRSRITHNLQVETPPVWSPDGRYLAYTERRYKTTYNMYILNIETREVTKISGLEGKVMAWTE
jgi:Tol biopolymer transport system component